MSHCRALRGEVGNLVPELRRILLVEDDLDLCKMLRRILEHDGYVVDEAHDGHAALSAYEAARPDLILTDLMMPGMEGEELLTELRRRHDDDSTPVLLLSASATREQTAARQKVAASLAKPFDTEELRQLVAALLDAD
jgi:DNA-binding response OmpR family regulator